MYKLILIVLFMMYSSSLNGWIIAPMKSRISQLNAKTIEKFKEWKFNIDQIKQELSNRNVKFDNHESKEGLVRLLIEAKAMEKTNIEINESIEITSQMQQQIYLPSQEELSSFDLPISQDSIPKEAIDRLYKFPRFKEIINHIKIQEFSRAIHLKNEDRLRKCLLDPGI